MYFLTGDLQLVKTPLEEAGEDLKTRASQLKDSSDLYESVSEAKDPFTKHFTQPRLFVVRNDGSGFELLTKEQLDYFFRTLKHVRDHASPLQSSESLAQRKDISVGTTPAKAHYFLSKLRSQQEQNLLRGGQFPQNALYALLHLREGPESEAFLQQQPEHYLVRQVIEYQPFEHIKQVAFHDDLDRHRKWRLSQVRYDSEFGVTHAPAKDGTLDLKKIEEEEAVARKIIGKILKERKTKRPEFKPSDLHLEYLRALN